MQPRIAHVISSPEGVGGAERVLAQLVEEGHGRGWHQLVLHPFARQASQLSYLFSPVAYKAIPCTSFLGLPALRRGLRRQICEFQPHLVHVHLFHAAAVVATMSRQATGQRILTHHHGGSMRWRGRTLAHHVDRIAGSRFDRIVAVSQSVQDFLIDCHGYDSSKIVLIPNGWTGTPEPIARPTGHPTIVCVANLRRQKAHDVLFRAIALVRERVPEVRLVLIGDGPRDSELRQLAAELDLGEIVSFMGAVDDVWPHLAKAKVFALSSDHEPLGIAVMEAMAAGLPVVATNAGGIPEMVVNGTTGYLVDRGDSMALADRLTDVLLDDSLADRMGEAGRKNADGMRADQMVGRYFELYRSRLEVSLP